jgi:hypothetical protein
MAWRKHGLWCMWEKHAKLSGCVWREAGGKSKNEDITQLLFAVSTDGN